MNANNSNQRRSPTAGMTPEERAAERRAALKWGAIIVGILGTSFTTGMVMLYVSATDPSFAVEPDYYNRALNWDEHAEQRRTNAELDWRIELQDQPGSTAGMRALTATLTNRDGNPIEDATVGVIAFHNARSANRFEFPMTPAGGGVFSAEQPLARAGWWEFRFTIVTPESTFTKTQTVQLQPLAGAGTMR